MAKWTGKYITSIDTGWQRAQAAKKQPIAVDFTNFAVWLYNDIYTSILLYTNPRHQKRVRTVFEQAVQGHYPKGLVTRTWDGTKTVAKHVGTWGVKDMRQASDHAKGSKTWTDSLDATYVHRTGHWVLYKDHYFDAPMACVLFVQALEARAAELQVKATQFHQLHKKLNAAKKNGTQELGRALKDIKKLADGMEGLTWMMPETKMVGLIRQHGIPKVKSYLGLVGKVQSAASTIEAHVSRGGTFKGALALVVVKEGLNCVPILGQVYGAALDCLIQGLPAVTSFFKTRIAITNRMSKGYFLKSDLRTLNNMAGANKQRGPNGLSP